MEKIRRTGKNYIALLLCAVMVLALMPCAWAEESVPEEAAPADSGIIDGAALNTMVLEYLGDKGISTKDIGIGFCYTATGDTWCYNGDTWFYPASMYKVPLMMLLSEKVKAGELTQDTLIDGRPISEIEELVLTYSNNDYAHTIRKELGGDEVWRQEAKKYATLEDSEYHQNYMLYCYFSTRFLTNVMQTLQASPEEYPNIIESLLPSEPSHYFRLSMEGRYDIAQKYGSYTDNSNDTWVGTTGIIYADNPIVVTVMTKNVPNAERVISDFAVKLTDYASKLDGQLPAYQNKVQKEAEEAQRLEEQRVEHEKQEQENAKRQAEEKKAREEAIVRQQEKQEKRKAVLFSAIVVLAMILTVVLIIVSIVKGKERAAKARRYEAYRRRYEAEQRSYEAEKPVKKAPPRRSYSETDDFESGFSPRH